MNEAISNSTQNYSAENTFDKVFNKANEIPSSFVYFIPMDNQQIALLIPIMPENVIYNDEGYKNFLSAFHKVYYDFEERREDPVGRVWIEHENISFVFHALEPFIEAIADIAEVFVIPYCLKEGLPKQDVFGAGISVIRRPRHS